MSETEKKIKKDGVSDPSDEGDEEILQKSFAHENTAEHVSRLNSSLDLSRLNKMLSRLAGNKFRIALYVDDEVDQLDDEILSAIADCYALLAKEKWYENWTSESAKVEIKKYFQANNEKVNLVSLLYKGDQVVGFCWGFIISANNPGDLAVHFSSSKLSNKENLAATRKWLAQTGGTEKLISIRELGILKQYNKIRAPMLCAPVFSRALILGCKYIFLRTPVNSESLKWSLGIGFVPVHFHVVNHMLLMLGNLEHTVKDNEFRILDYFASLLTDIIDRDGEFEEVLHQKELNYAEKMHVMQGLSANIAHEMRTPLSGIRASMDGIESYLPVLLEAYQLAINENTENPSVIREDHLKVLEKTPERINLMIDQANSVIDMLLMNLRDNTVEKAQFGIYSAADCIEQALDAYPFKRGERDKLTVNVEHDFYFLGLDNLFIYVIFNLLKNALYSINSALKGQISIKLVSGEGLNSIVFRDTGEGIEEEVMSRIFDGFFSTREEGTGVGLAFCRRTIKSFSGNISCNSVYGEYTEFVLTLPAT